MDNSNKKDKSKRPLKLSNAGRLQLRKNLGPGQTSNFKGNKSKGGKTIQIVLRKKNNQQQRTSTTKYNSRGSSSSRVGDKSSPQFSSPIIPKKNKNFVQKNKKVAETKKAQAKKTSLKPITGDEKSGKLNVNKILEKEEQEFDKFPSLAKLKRAREREKEKLKEGDDVENKFSREVIIPEIITVQELANRMAEKVADVVKSLMKMGVMANAAQSLEADTAEIIVTEFGHKAKIISETSILKEIEDYEDKENELANRPPVVTIMGHVDHGKTSILDALRQAKVAENEAGGITQHIGAYQINENDKIITFIDTPGHEAFSNMRSRGAKTTDIVVLVVAANDGVKPQTIEAISHAKAAKVPIIVAINKIDLGSADPDKVRNELLSQEIIVEKLKGDVQDIEVSALKKTNLDKLKEAINLQAEILNLKANPSRSCRGVIIESKLEKGRGPVATVLVQKGTLKVGDIFVSGAEWGKVKALIDYNGKNIDKAPPSCPVEVLGFDSAPLAGDDFIVLENESSARKVSEFRQFKNLQKKNTVIKTNVEEMFEKISAGKIAELSFVIKADVQGSAEAIVKSLNNLSTDEVKTNVIFKGVGAITESDVALASSSKGFIIGFNVRAIPQARDLAKRDGIDIKYYSIIYELIDDIKKLMSGMLKPDVKEEITGNIEIREVFKISKIGNVGGCFVKEGHVKRNSKVRILRDSIVIHEGVINSLKRFKEEIKEVQQGYECGIMIQDFNDFKINDIIEPFEIIEKTRSL